MLQNGKFTTFTVFELFCVCLCVCVRAGACACGGGGLNLPPTSHQTKVKARETYMEWLNDLFGYVILPANVNPHSVDIVIYMLIPRNSDTIRTNLEPTANVLGLLYLIFLQTMIIMLSKKSKVISHIINYIAQIKFFCKFH